MVAGLLESDCSADSCACSNLTTQSTDRQICAARTQLPAFLRLALQLLKPDPHLSGYWGLNCFQALTMCHPESVGGGLQNMVVMKLCQGGSLLQVLQNDDGRRKPREFGWCAAFQL